MTPAIARGDVRLLALVARLPFASTRHLAVLCGEPAPAGAYRCAARLLERGLLAWLAGPLVIDGSLSRARHVRA